MFTHRRRLLPSRGQFALRLARQGVYAVAVVLAALLLGVIGYHAIGGLAWIDAELNAAMILSGMGPVDELHTNGGKLFAAAYALFSGFVFLTVAAVLFAPVFYRVLHRFHLEMVEEPESGRTENAPRGRGGMEKGTEGK